MIKASKRTAIVTISEKLNSAQRLRIGDLNDLDFLVTELSPKHEQLAPYLHSGLIIL
jgi:DeoR/GlpR family transcriptional regulator of sugar metabolism